MSDEAPTMFFIVAIVLAGMTVPGIAIGYQWSSSVSREKFIIYCTGKGDTYQACDDIWNARPVSPPTTPEDK